MFSLEIDTDADERDLLIAELWELGSAGIVELSATRVRAFFDAGADRAAVRERYPGAAVREEEDRDWVAEARELLQPMEVGRRFFLVPEWRDDAAPPGRFRIMVNPGMAFGTGVHETTRLCLEALEELIKTGMTVLDVGTGSGILAEAAGLLGARRVIACDVDEEAVRIAGRGFVGSADAVRSAAADLVVANISPEAIIKLAPEFARVLRAGGTLVASGFNASEVEMVKAALGKAREVRRKGEWAAVVAEMEISFEKIEKEFSETFGYVRQDIAELLKNDRPLHYTIALLVCCACEMLTWHRGLRDDRAHEVFTSLLTEPYKAVGKTLWESLRNGLAHKFRPDTIRIEDDWWRFTVFSARSGPPVRVTKGQPHLGGPHWIHLNVRILSERVISQIDAYEQELRTNPNARLSFQERSERYIRTIPAGATSIADTLRSVL